MDIRYNIDEQLKKTSTKSNDKLKTPCSQCGLPMLKSLAKIQAENNRANHPICEHCVIGRKRSTVIR